MCSVNQSVVDTRELSRFAPSDAVTSVCHRIGGKTRTLAVLLSCTLASLGVAQPAGTPVSYQLRLKGFDLRYSGQPQLDAVLLRADSALVRGAKAEAIAAYERVLDAKPYYPHVEALVWADRYGQLGSALLPEQPAEAAKVFERGLQQMEGHRDDAEHRVALEYSLASAYEADGRPEKTLQTAREAYDSARSAFGDRDVDTLVTLEMLVQTLVNQGYAAEALLRARELQRTAALALGENHWEVARARTLLGLSEVHSQQYKEALIDLAAARQLWDGYAEAPESDMNQLDAGFAGAAGILEHDSRASAETQLRAVLDQTERDGSKAASTEVGVTLARRYLRQRRWTEAIAVYERVLPIAEKTPYSDTTLLHILNGLGVSEYATEDLPAAEAHLRRAVALAQPRGDSDELQGNLDYLARVLAGRGAYPEALEHTRAAAALAERLPFSPAQLADQWEATGLLYIAGAQPILGIPYLKRALETREKLEGAHARAVGIGAYWIALAAARGGDRAMAEHYAGRALRIHSQCCADSEDVSDEKLLLGYLRGIKGADEEGRGRRLLQSAFDHRWRHHSKRLRQAQLFWALFLFQHNEPEAGAAVLKTLGSWPDALSQPPYHFLWSPDLLGYEEDQYWQSETRHYCANAPADAAVPLCRPLDSAHVRAPAVASRNGPQ